ncbi:hypothetical protein Acr_00g0016310 [Actinidia rufa]|uniref:Uncharacterized protein n=1 Tax=Actinidia rufa TaxID=165716 RepID=A0A7J0DAW0_9ERIC|nr:hypothetical protein Acr_00g0016310 [Actinidia rufa]
MLLPNHNNGGPQSTELDLLLPSHGDTFDTGESQCLSVEIDNTCSTLYVNALDSVRQCAFEPRSWPLRVLLQRPVPDRNNSYRFIGFAIKPRVFTVYADFVS